MNLMPRRPAAFPYAPPTWPGGVERPPKKPHTGLDYDTAWARTHGARIARTVIVDDVLRPLVHLIGAPSVHGLDRLADLDEPAIFAANHHSHLDTPILLSALPRRWRHRAVVAAAADYFFTSRSRSAVSALAIGAIPIERNRVNRRSSDLAAELLSDGWSLVLFPEGGRSPDGWAQDFRGGAAYLSVKTARPLVPVFMEGTRQVLKKGDNVPTSIANPFRRGATVRVLFGSPMRANDGEDARRFSVRVEAAVAALGDEWSTDWWSARKRAARSATPSLAGPSAAPWRRAWALDAGAHKKVSEPAWP
jgi:1-acyl-sn-glycerol-3-phosphate acyltransferase